MSEVTETIPGLGAPPLTTDPDNFDPRADNLYGTTLPAAIASMNIAFGQVNVVSGEVSANAAAVASAAPAAVGAANYVGVWSSLTGALAIPASVSHSGNVWILSDNVEDVTAVEPGVSSVWISAIADPVGDEHVTVTTGNGNGSPSTKIRRFTTTQSSAGADIVYADSATDGGSFTIATGGEGFYSISYQDASGGNFAMGVSVNSSQLSTDVSAITAADRLLFFRSNSAGVSGSVSGVFYLEAGDVIRAHGGITSSANPPSETSAYLTKFEIRKVGA